jgi:hypothetical protein
VLAHGGRLVICPRGSSCQLSARATLGELWWLADIAQDCQADGRHTMFFSSAPLHVAGGISSPPNAVVIK